MSEDCCGASVSADGIQAPAAILNITHDLVTAGFFADRMAAIPNPIDQPPGCRFHPRCPVVVPECRGVDPQLHPVAPNHGAARVLAPGTKGEASA